MCEPKTNRESAMRINRKTGRPETYEELVARVNACACLIGDPPQKRETSMKVISKKELTTLVSSGKASAKEKRPGTEPSHDWALLTDGKSYELICGEDYPATSSSKNDKPDMTEEAKAKRAMNNFLMNLNGQAAKIGKKIELYTTETGIIVTAIPMTEAEKAKRAETRAKLQAAHAAKKAEKNGTPQAETAPAEGAFEDEPEPQTADA